MDAVFRDIVVILGATLGVGAIFWAGMYFHSVLMSREPNTSPWESGREETVQEMARRVNEQVHK